MPAGDPKVGGGGRRPAGAQAGQATVELALCLPLVALVLAAVVEVCLIAGDQARLWHAAREAARIAVVDPDHQDVEEAARGSGLDSVEVSIRPEPAYRTQGSPLTVELAYQPASRVPLLGQLVGLVKLESRATMRIEQP
ncbi:MAG: pilus assembly protein [Actinobacteria bacterium]|nr:pilus assembly protein [Actinomycetota bacterium]